MVHNSIGGSVVPKAVALVAGLGVVAGLALAAPARAASPSTAAARIVEARNHKKPDAGNSSHRTDPRDVTRDARR